MRTNKSLFNIQSQQGEKGLGTRESQGTHGTPEPHSLDPKAGLDNGWKELEASNRNRIYMNIIKC